VDERHTRPFRPAAGDARPGGPALPGPDGDRALDLLRGIDAIVWEMDAVTCRYTFVGGRAVEVLGYPVRDWLAADDFNRVMVHPDDYGRVVEEARRATAESRHHRIEYRAVTADGRTIWLRDWIRVLRGADGRPRTLRGVTVDVTERKEAERALRDSEERLRQIADAIEDVVYMDDTATRRYLYVSPAYERIWGRSCASLYADPDSWLEAVHPEDRARLAAAMERLAAAGFEGEWREEYRIVRADGSVRWVWDVSSPIRDASGKVVRMVGCTRDITARKEREAAMRQMSARLLRSQDEERRRIARELHDSTAQMLAALGMNLEALRRTSGGLRRGARARLASSRRLLEQCVQEIRTLSYLLHPPLLDEAGLRAAIRSYARGFSERSGIRVEVRLPSAVGRLPRDVELTLFRIVQESLSNIHRHSGSRIARIGMARDNGRVRLVVRDRGRGIDPGRLGAAMSAESAGIGVGIAGMRERVRQLGGDLAVQSTPGGTTVSVSLPVPVRS
jgi:PAS domain S-box-containing protein